MTEFNAEFVRSTALAAAGKNIPESIKNQIGIAASEGKFRCSVDTLKMVEGEGLVDKPIRHTVAEIAETLERKGFKVSTAGAQLDDHLDTVSSGYSRLYPKFIEIRW